MIKIHRTIRLSILAVAAINHRAIQIEDYVSHLPCSLVMSLYMSALAGLQQLFSALQIFNVHFFA
jgi:hypothetical protein